MSEPVTFRNVVVDAAGVVRHPLNLFEANAESIYDAIASLITVTGSFDATTAPHAAATAGLLAGTTTVKQALDILDGLTIPAGYTFNASTEAHGGTTTGKLAGTTTVAQLATIVDGLVIPAGYTFNSSTEAHGGTTTGRLAGTTTIKQLADAFDGLVVVSSKEYSLPFTYMMLSKCFGNLGWVTEEVSNANYYFSCGGYETANAVQQNGTAYIEIMVPPNATEVATTAAFQFYFFGNNTTGTNCKYDLTIYVTKNGTTGKTNLYSVTGQVLSSTTVPTFVSIDKASLLTNLTASSLTTGDRRLIIELEFYSKSNYSVKLMQGMVNLVG